MQIQYSKMLNERIYLILCVTVMISNDPHLILFSFPSNPSYSKDRHVLYLVVSSYLLGIKQSHL